MRECNNKCFGAGAGDCDNCQKEYCEIREKKQLESGKDWAKHFLDRFNRKT